jgi:hypothetical protein
MPNKKMLPAIKSLFVLFVLFQFISTSCLAQETRIDMKEMKDTVNLMIATIKELEKGSVADSKKLEDVRTRLSVLTIYNGPIECGSWPSPSAKIEIIEAYWKCTFDKAPYGKKLVLHY